MVPDLSPTFKKSLFVKAQSLKPVIRLGNNGLTEAVHQEIEVALKAHELIKIKIRGATPEIRKSIYDQILTTHQAIMIQQIGHIIVLYRKKAESD